MAKQRLLIIDDEKDFVDTLAERLEAKGYDIVTKDMLPAEMAAGAA